MIRKIIGAKDPILRRVSKPIRKIDKKILSLIADLKETLLAQKDPEGVGLAAPQIGKNLQIFIMRPDDKLKTIINPEIISISKQKKGKKQIMEGCLSIPNYYSPLRRVEKIKIKYLTEDGKEKVETFEGFPAQIVDHEIDHLNGILFTDRVLEQKKPLYKLKADEWEKVDLII
ncbi:peptide deformylase [Candidatus Woesebacteria bacterium]|nr:peptide deformylase [Candidatus Woesebacteria bacterium]